MQKYPMTACQSVWGFSCRLGCGEPLLNISGFMSAIEYIKQTCHEYSLPCSYDRVRAAVPLCLPVCGVNPRLVACCIVSLYGLTLLFSLSLWLLRQFLYLTWFTAFKSHCFTRKDTKCINEKWVGKYEAPKIWHHHWFGVAVMCLLCTPRVSEQCLSLRCWYVKMWGDISCVMRVWEQCLLLRCWYVKMCGGISHMWCVVIPRWTGVENSIDNSNNDTLQHTVLNNAKCAMPNLQIKQETPSLSGFLQTKWNELSWSAIMFKYLYHDRFVVLPDWELVVPVSEKDSVLSEFVRCRSS